MNNKTIGEIIKVRKLWWLKINKKTIRTHALDGAVFPSLLQVKYAVNNEEYIGKKLVCWDNLNIQEEKEVDVYYNEDKPQKILKLERKR